MPIGINTLVSEPAIAAPSFSLSITLFDPALACTESIEGYVSTLTFQGPS